MRLAFVLSLLVLPCLFAPAQAQGKKYALLVGVTEYDHARLSSLKYTENDIEGLNEILRKPSAGFASVRVLTVTRGKKDRKDAPTKKNIDEALDELFSKKTRRDTILLALAGHGVQLEVRDKEKEDNPSKTYSYFCPSDADFEKISYSTGKAPQLILMDDVFKRLSENGAGTKLIFVDACRNELKADSTTRSLDTGKLTIGAGVGALFSCKSGERAWESSKFGKGHGAFFHYVLEGLRGKAKDEDGEVRWDLLTRYVTRRVSADVPKLIEDGAKQTPHGASNFEGEAPLLVGKAGPADETDATFRKGMDYLVGRGVTLDAARAEELLQEAAKKGNPLAQATLCWSADYRSFAVGQQRIRELKPEALAALKKAAGEGDADAQVTLAKLHMRLGAGETDPKAADRLAYELMSKAAEKGQPMGLNDKAHLTASSRGVQGGGVEGRKLYLQAAERGVAQSMFNLGRMYQSGHGGVAKDAEEAARWYQKAAEANHPWAQVALARMYRAGEGVEKDSAKAFSWCKKAAEQGLADAQNLLGVLYRQGEGTGNRGDSEEAARWYEKAAEQGDANGQYNLANLYLDGDGVARSDEKAFAWMKKAAASPTFALAHWRLGWMYENGRGPERDYEEAIRWYRRAADRGLVQAYFDVGRMHEEGNGIGQSDAEALRWYRKAAEKGHKDATAKVKKLGR